MARISIDLDESLVAKAMRLGGINTKKEAVRRALEEFVASRSRRRRSLSRYAGRFKFCEGFDPVNLLKNHRLGR